MLLTNGLLKFFISTFLSFGTLLLSELPTISSSLTTQVNSDSATKDTTLTSDKNFKAQLFLQWVKESRKSSFIRTPEDSYSKMDIENGFLNVQPLTSNNWKTTKSKRESNFWQKVGSLRKKLVYRIGRKNEFLWKNIYVTPAYIYEFLNYLKDWQDLTLHERHRLLREGRLYRPLKLFLVTQAWKNMIFTKAGKVRKKFALFNKQIGLDKLVKRMLEKAGVPDRQDNDPPEPGLLPSFGA